MTKQETITYLKSLNKTILERWLRFYHIEIINMIESELSLFFNLENMVFKEKLYLFINEITEKKLCLYCNKNTTTLINTIQGYRDYCSSKCATNDPNIQLKKEEKYLKKYGVKHSTLNKDVQAKMKASTLEKYGVENISQLQSIKQKKKETCIRNYGTEYYMQTDISKENNRNTINKNRNKLNKAIFDKYGVSNVSNVKSVMDKKIQTFLNKTIINLSDLKYLTLIKYTDNYDIEFQHNICNHQFNINRQLLHLRINKNRNICTICDPIYNHSSYLELDVLNYIKTIYNKEILTQYKFDKNSKMSLDIYLPDLNIGFEVNGLIWHSSLYRDKSYHEYKYKLCKNNNIRLINIWEDDWLYKQEIIKDIINKSLNITTVIYGRKTKLKQIDSNIEKEFLNKNHLQGYVKSKICYGLFYNNELISIMSFSNKRIFMNKNNKSNINDYELLRFVNKLNYTIIGGGSKLFNFFINNNSYNEIISYCDLSYFTGSIYESLKFKYISTTVDYHYLINGLKEHRYKYAKHILVEQGYDKNKTEEEIMADRGYYKIFGVGQMKYIYQ